MTSKGWVGSGGVGSVLCLLPGPRKDAACAWISTATSNQEVLNHYSREHVNSEWHRDLGD